MTSPLLSRSCSACRRAPAYRHHLPRAAFSTRPHVQARNNGRDAPSKSSLTERIRRKLWGTEKPPGQEDPYDARSGGRGRKVRRTETSIEEVPVESESGVAYEPAQTWDGLERVGGFEGWEEEWDREFRFRGFLPAKTLSSTPQLTSALHRAVVEVITLQQAGRPLGDVANIGIGGLEDSCARVDVTADEQDVKLNYPSEDVREQILQSVFEKEIEEESAEEEEAAVEELTEREEAEWEDMAKSDLEQQQPENELSSTTDLRDALKHTDALDAAEVAISQAKDAELAEIIATWDPSWLKISIQDPNIKFAILKRTLQLTGRRVPDPAIASLQTVQTLLQQLITPPPKKLADTLMADERLASLPNVQVFGRRITPIDKEITVGRWKVIERELKERGLPVTGHN